MLSINMQYIQTILFIFFHCTLCSILKGPLLQFECEKLRQVVNTCRVHMMIKRFGLLRLIYAVRPTLKYYKKREYKRRPFRVRPSSLALDRRDKFRPRSSLEKETEKDCWLPALLLICCHVVRRVLHYFKTRKPTCDRNRTWKLGL